MNDYAAWETQVTEALRDALEITYGDAAGIVEAQPFIMSQAWGRDSAPSDVARKLADA